MTYFLVIQFVAEHFQMTVPCTQTISQSYAFGYFHTMKTEYVR